MVTHKLPNRHMRKPNANPMTKIMATENHGSVKCNNAQHADVTADVPTNPSLVCERAVNNWPRKMNSSASGAPRTTDGNTSMNKVGLWAISNIACLTSPIVSELSWPSVGWYCATSIPNNMTAAISMAYMPTIKPPAVIAHPSHPSLGR